MSLDHRLRELERQALQEDRQASLRLAFERSRLGRPRAGSGPPGESMRALARAAPEDGCSSLYVARSAVAGHPHPLFHCLEAL